MSELRWIPASERLPEIGDIVGVCAERGGRTEQTFCRYDGEQWLDEDGIEVLSDLRVSAWVPIRTFVCPHCRDTAHPNTLSPESISLARCQCHHCANEFFIVNDEPVTLADYVQMNSP